ncbi:MAG: NUDIX hydrolase [Candidatus Magasanikbacteria bacterium]
MKIPNQAKKVFTGVIFDVYQWEQEMFDGSKATFERIHRAPSVECIAIVDDKIITLEQTQPNRDWYPSLPGGRIDEGEQPAEAITRELLEETGYTAESFELYREYTGNSKLYFPEYIFIARNCKKTSEQDIDGGEKINVKLSTFDEFLDMFRDTNCATSIYLKSEIYEVLLDDNEKEKLKQKLFGK